MEEAMFLTLIILFIVFIVYGVIPWICTAVLGFGVFRKGPSCHEVAFTFSKVTWKKKVMVSLWLKWEKVFNWLVHIHPIDENHPFLNVRIRTYWGKTVQLSDGEKIKRGDHVLELHFNNEVLYNMGIQSRSTIQLAIQMIRTTEQLLPKTLPIILNHPNYEKIKALYGVSMIHRGTKQFGFTVCNLPRGPFSFFTRIYLRLLLSVVHPQGKDRLQNKVEHLVPKMMVMSTKELMRRYPS